VAGEIGVTYRPELLVNPAQNLRMGAHYLERILGRFGGQIALAAAAYNAGPHAVSRWLGSGERLPLDVWVARIPYTETRKYVTRVVGNFARYAYLKDGGSVPSLDLELPEGLRADASDY
jgi:soluble lytic murein transglycosylase